MYHLNAQAQTTEGSVDSSVHRPFFKIEMKSRSLSKKAESVCQTFLVASLQKIGNFLLNIFPSSTSDCLTGMRNEISVM